MADTPTSAAPSTSSADAATGTPGAHAELLARHRAVLPSWLALYYDEPIEIVGGEGRTVWDGEGNVYLDFFGGILTTMTAHALPEVVDALRDQAGRMLHTSTLYLIRPMVELAERLAALAPMPDAKVFFTNSGSEANDAALLLATTVRRSNQVLVLRNSYHGRTFQTIALTTQRAWSPTSLSGLAVSTVPNGDALRGPFAGLEGDAMLRACSEEFATVLETETAGDVACLIAEPIQGVGGFHVVPDGLLRRYHDLCREHGILYVTDEVQTGWGRTGEHFWGVQAHGVTPDMATFAKGLGNGTAMAGVIARAEVMDSISANSISTFGGNPLSCRAALANLGYLLDHDLQANAAEMGDRLRARLAPYAAKVPAVADVRGKGLMQAVELVDPDGVRGPLTPAPHLAAAVLNATKAHGVLIGKGGLHGNCLRIAPPLSVTADEVDRAADVIGDAIVSVCG